MTADRIEKRRVVHLIGQIGLGGSERQLLLLLQHLDRERYESHLVVFNSSPYGEIHEELDALGVPVITVPEDCRGVLARVRFLTQELRRIAPDVVHSWTAHDNPYASVVGRLVGARARLGSLRTTARSILMENLPPLYRWLVLRGVGRLVVNSLTALEELQEQGIAKRRLRLLHNCVPLEPFDTTPPADLTDLGITSEHRVTGLVGNLRAVKDHPFFVDAMARVLPDFPDLRVVLVGQPLPSEPDYPQRIEERMAQHGLTDRFVITGFRADIPAVLRRMELSCLTSKSEGLPNAVLESMAASRPVVATRVGGVPELITDGDNGYLIDPGDVEGFAQAVRQLLDDPKAARKMGRRGRQHVERNHSCANAARQLAALYEETLATAGHIL